MLVYESNLFIYFAFSLSVEVEHVNCVATMNKVDVWVSSKLLDHILGCFNFTHGDETWSIFDHCVGDELGCLRVSL